MTSPAQKKAWIDHTGPMAFQITVPASFSAYGSGIYTQQIGAPNGGVHAMLAVGFNDDDRCWIVKNSYGPAWGEQGFVRMSYDALDAANNVVPGGGLLENAGFVGMRGTNPDPWSNRRQRNGALIQGGNGARHNNFELFLRVENEIRHWYRDNAPANPAWATVSSLQPRDPYDRPFGTDALDCPAAVQSSFNRNFELIYRSSNGRLRHTYFNQSSGWWNDADRLGPQSAVGIPGFIQSNRGAPGDFEVIIITPSGQAEHWTKHNGGPWDRLPGEWYRKETFGSSFRFGGPALVQSKLGISGSPENGRGELHFVCTNALGVIEHWRRDGPVVGTWTLLGSFGANVDSGPCMIEGTRGAGNEMNPGNFELCVAVGGQIEHWWRHNASLGSWVRSAIFGGDVRRVVGLLQSTIGTNLEVIAELSNGRFQHFFRSGAGWLAGAIIV